MGLQKHSVLSSETTVPRKDGLEELDEMPHVFRRG